MRTRPEEKREIDLRPMEDYKTMAKASQKHCELARSLKTMLSMKGLPCMCRKTQCGILGPSFSPNEQRAAELGFSAMHKELFCLRCHAQGPSPKTSPTDLRRAPKGIAFSKEIVKGPLMVIRRLPVARSLAGKVYTWVIDDVVT